MSGQIEERRGPNQRTANKLEQRYAELVGEYLAALRDKVNDGTSSSQDRQILDTLARAYGI
jgi:hypothetical protein